MSGNPLKYLEKFLKLKKEEREYLKEYYDFMVKKGNGISLSIDRLKTPWLKMYNEKGERIDEILYPNEYYELLYEGYRRGVVWRVFEEDSLKPFFTLGYITSYFDPGLYCPYTVSLATALSIYKYGTEELKNRFLNKMLLKDKPYQGATWMTEIKGGSDLGYSVETVAYNVEGEMYKLKGEKYFASNAGAELAIVAARPEGAQKGVRGLALFLVPKYKRDGSLNYFIRRIKDKIGTRSVPTAEVILDNSEGYLLGKKEEGIYLILESLNISRVANSVGSVAIAKRAFDEALEFANQRFAFGKKIIEHPLLRKQKDEISKKIELATALAFETVSNLEGVYKLKPRYNEEYHLTRLLTHLSKYLTAEIAVSVSIWAMEVFGGLGILEEMGVERFFRESIILPIWEGTPHRQILDGIEVMEKKGAHRLFFDKYYDFIKDEEREIFLRKIEDFLNLEQEEKEEESEKVFKEFAEFVSRVCFRKISSKYSVIGEKVG